MERNYIAAVFVGLTVLAVALVGAMAVSGAVGADTVQESNDDKRISVDATGDASAEPDVAVLHAAVRVTGEDPQAVREGVAQGAADLEAALDEAGVDYKTTSYQIREERRRPEAREESSLVGIHAFEITVDNPDDVGDVVEVAASAGAEIQHVEMTLTEESREELREEAIQNAMDDARTQADTIAAAGDLTVTGVINVDASQHRYVPTSYTVEDAGGDGAAQAPPTNIDLGDVSVSYNVEVTFDATSS